MEDPKRRITKRVAVTIICAMLVSSGLIFGQKPIAFAASDELTGGSSSGYPYILSTDPADGENWVPLRKEITVIFNETINLTSLWWSIDPNPGGGWFVTCTSTYVFDDTLIFEHFVPFAEFTTYVVSILIEDSDGFPLDPTKGAPNPWSFTTAGANPIVIGTVPFDGEVVNISQIIQVAFSEPMDNTSVTWLVSPNTPPHPPLGEYTAEWFSNNTIMELSHTTYFQDCYQYVVAITGGTDLEGDPLNSSQYVPNPWSFSTGITPPRNLRVVRTPPDVTIQWDAVPGADIYNVYESQDRFAWPWNLLGTVVPPNTQYIHVGAHSDLATHYYIVRASDSWCVTGNSTMGVKTRLGFEIAVNINTTDINWLSLPYNSIYKKASDIASELTHNKIRVIGKWDSSKQKARIYSYYSSMWRGDNFDINPGDGIFIAGLQQNFSWIVTGTDLNIAIDFKHSPKHRWTYYWPSIPYTGIYTNASSIVMDIEGSLFISAKLIELGKWDPATQSSIKYRWNGSQWTGTDFSINPGDGIYFRIKSDFNWPIKLVTPAVP